MALPKPTNGTNSDYANRIGALFDFVDAAAWAVRGLFGTCALFGKENSALAADAQLNITGSANGMFFVIRQNTDGGMIIGSVDCGLAAVTIISDPSARAATVDPGAGGNKLWISAPGAGQLRITNRYGTAKSVSLSVVTAGAGNPS